MIMKTFAACILAACAMGTEHGYSSSTPQPNLYHLRANRGKSPDQEKVEELENRIDYFKWQCKAAGDALEGEYQRSLVALK